MTPRPYRCACCRALFQLTRLITREVETRYCPACSGAEPSCTNCEGQALTRAIAHHDKRQKDMFR